MNTREDYIGIFDSGLGGISVLRHLRRVMPEEKFLYFGDSANAPYGTKTKEEVRALTFAAMARMMEKGLKAFVVACNTATSAAVNELRAAYPEMIIIGIEPALKPAAERHPGGRILVMATAMTLKEKKFFDLWEQYRDQAEIVPVPCSGLMEFVEQGILRGDEVERFLLEKLEPFTKVPVDAVVLGCTHYPFLLTPLRRILGRRPEILDSAEGVARQLERRLQELDLLNPRQSGGKVSFENSLEGPEMLDLSRSLLDYSLDL